eukprot:2958423-Pleurochrysis_carterae.AAC.1
MVSIVRVRERLALRLAVRRFTVHGLVAHEAAFVGVISRAETGRYAAQAVIRGSLVFRVE